MWIDWAVEEKLWIFMGSAFIVELSDACGAFYLGLALN